MIVDLLDRESIMFLFSINIYKKLILRSRNNKTNFYPLINTKLSVVFFIFFNRLDAISTPLNRNYEVEILGE